MAAIIDDGSVKLINLITGLELKTFNKSEAVVTAFHPTKSLFAVGTHRAIKFIDLETGDYIHEIKTRKPISSLAFDHTGSHVAATIFDTTDSDDTNDTMMTTVWDINSSQRVHSFQEVGMAYALAFDNNHNIVCIYNDASCPKRINWDMRTARVKNQEPLPTNHISLAALDNQGKRLILGSTISKNIEFQNRAASPLTSIITDETYLKALALSGDGRTIATVNTDDKISVWQEKSILIDEK